MSGLPMFPLKMFPEIAGVVTDHIGQLASLAISQVRLSVLQSIDQYDEQADQHRTDRNFGLGIRTFFARLTTAESLS
jgi:hypothetical protein